MADTEIPKIDIGGEYQHVLHVSQFITFPVSLDRYGNLDLKWLKIISILIQLNQKIDAAYELHGKSLSHSISFPCPSQALWFILEEIAYWFRKASDELISLSFLCNSFQNGTMPDKIEIDCIGRLLKPGDSSLKLLYLEHFDFLRRLNDIFNAYKHSFVNSELNIVGRDEPVLYALPLLGNDFKNEIQPVGISLALVIREFNGFFQTAKAYLKTWPQAAVENA